MIPVVFRVVLYKKGVQHGLQIVVGMFLRNDGLLKDFLHRIDLRCERPAAGLVINHTYSMGSRFLVPYHVQTVDDAAHVDGDLSD